MTHTHPATIYTAIDTDNLDRALELAKEIGPITGGLKLGMEFINTFGPQGVQAITEAYPDTDLFIDLKFHDIPNTVAKAIKTVSETLKPTYLNIHAAGGFEMMRAAKEACAPHSKLLAVTILTSMNEDEMRNVGYQTNIQAQVHKMAFLAKEAGCDGVVCSAHEIEIIRKACGRDFILMVPGIRPAGADQGDQERIMTPRQALSKGATHLVIGRPITQADNPAQAAAAIITDISK